MTRHIVIPDTQVKPGVPLDYMDWIGRYIADKRPDVVVHLGDHWDMPSLSLYDKGKASFEGRRYTADIEAGNEAMRRLTAPIDERVEKARRAKRGQWKPRLVLLRGNHEDRQQRAVNDDAKLEGLMKDSDFESPGWEVVPFLVPIVIDGIRYAHYFYNPMSGRPYGGQSMDTRLKTIGCSFGMGHQQQLMVGIREAAGVTHRGFVAGACYPHDEDYKGPQGNQHWRGILVLNQVEDGNYSLTEVTLDFLCQRNEGITLDEYRKKHGLELSR